MVRFGLAVVVAVLLSFAADAAGKKAASPPPPAKVDPGEPVKPFKVKVKNQYAESAFTITYRVTYADGAKEAKGTVAKDARVLAYASEKFDVEVPVKNANDKVTFVIKTLSAGQTSTFDYSLDMKAKGRVLIFTYDLDPAAMQFRFAAKWGLF